MSEAPFVDIAPAGRLLVLSPHLDDGVFSCGRLLASLPGATVATVFAGRPDPGMPLTDWDRAAGFTTGDDVVGRRREEDRHALESLGGRPRWLDLRDSQYGSPTEDEVVAQLHSLLADYRPDTLFIPLGLFHSDHQLVHRAAMALFDEWRHCRWFIYEDALYRRIDGLRDEGFQALRQRGFQSQPARLNETTDAARRKDEAVACYRSQLRALETPGRPGLADLLSDEGYWLLLPPPRETS